MLTPVRRLFLFVLLTICYLPNIWAETVYRRVDAQGNVSFSEEPPAEGEQGVEAIDVNPNQNVLSPEQFRELPLTADEAMQRQRVKKVERDAANKIDPVVKAQEALDEARQALAEGEVVQQGDFMGKAGGGVRPSSQRLERIERLQKQVKDAEAALRAARNNIP